MKTPQHIYGKTYLYLGHFIERYAHSYFYAFQLEAGVGSGKVWVTVSRTMDGAVAAINKHRAQVRA